MTSPSTGTDSAVELLHAAIDNVDEAVLGCDAHGELVFANPTAVALGTTAPLSRALAGEPVCDLEIVTTDHAGRRRVLLANGRAVGTEAGAPVGAVVAVRDVTEQDDAVTGLPTRSCFIDRLRAAAGDPRVERSVVACVDIDGFHRVNEVLGHAAGDALLRKVASRIAAAVDDGDVVARVGADEFGVICACPLAKSGGARIGRKILDAVAAPFDLGGTPLSVSASVGVASVDFGADPDRVLRDAAVATRWAKEAGGSRLELISPALPHPLRPVGRFEHALASALDGNELRLVYQPEITIASGRTFAMEALLRWEHPEYGSVPPDRFIPVAEQSGLIVAMGSWVLTEACREAAGWTSPTPAVVGVNISTRQLHANLVSTVVRALSESGLEPGRLCLEVTETAAVADFALAASVLDDLRQLGVMVSMDDFGAGYSCLASLRRLPVDLLKIDRELVEAMGSTGEDDPITEAVIAMAHALGAEVVAEGLETEEQLVHLERLGCEHAQGYYFSPPLEVPDARRFLTRAGSPGAVRPRD